MAMGNAIGNREFASMASAAVENHASVQRDAQSYAGKAARAGAEANAKAAAESKAAAKAEGRDKVEPSLRMSTGDPDADQTDGGQGVEESETDIQCDWRGGATNVPPVALA